MEVGWFLVLLLSPKEGDQDMVEEVCGKKGKGAIVEVCCTGRANLS